MFLVREGLAIADFCFTSVTLLLLSVRVAKYRIVISLHVCASVCLFARTRNSKTARPNLNIFVHVACDRAWLGPPMIALYLLPVLRMTSCFHGRIGRRTDTALCTTLPVAAGEAQAAVGRPPH